MRNIASHFSKLLLLVVTLSLTPLNLWGQISIVPESPIAGQTVRLKADEPKAKDSKITWKIIAIELSDDHDAFTELEDESDLIPFPFETTVPGRFQVYATVQKADGNEVTLDAPLVVRSEPTAEEPTAEEPTAEEPTAEEPTAEEPATRGSIESELGLTYYTWKFIQEQDDEIKLEDNDPRVRDSYAVVAKAFTSQAGKAPRVGLSRRDEDIKAANDFIDESINVAFENLKKQPHWIVFKRRFDRPIEAEVKWEQVLNNFKVRLKEDLYDRSNKQATYFQNFTWAKASKEIGDGFKNAEAEFTQFIKEYNKVNKAIYNRYMQEFGPIGSGIPRYSGPDCPLLIWLGI